MELIKNCELVKVEIINGKRCEMKFYDKENDVLRTVKFNRQSWDSSKGSFVDDPEKEAKCEEWANTYFGCSFDEIPTKTGAVKDVYVYENFNSLWETEETERPKRFTSPIRSIITTTIEDVIIDTIGIHVLYRYKGELYESKYTCAEYIKSMIEGHPLENIVQQAHDLRYTEGRKFFDPLQNDVFPQDDFGMCIDYDKFDFIIRVEQRDGLFHAEKVNVHEA